MQLRRAAALILASSLLLLLAGCSSGDDDDDDSDSTGTGTQGQPAATQPAASQPAPTQASAGQSSGQSQPAPTTAASQPAPTTAPAGSSGQQSSVANELATLNQTWQAVRSFRAQLTVEAPGVPKQEGTLEAVLPDRVHVTMSGGGLPQPIEMIFIGQSGFYKFAGAWSNNAIPGLQNNTVVTQLRDPKSLITYVANFQSGGATKGGTDTVNGRTCQIYTYTGQGNTRYELCVANNLPLRGVSDGAGIRTVIVFSDYNASITINPPS